MQLSKSDFMQYLGCPKSLWLLKREPQNFPQGESSVFDAKLAKDGNDVEETVRCFLEGVGRSAEFQRVFRTECGLYARADAVESTRGSKTILHEVKSSTGIREEHVKDACFQKICAERAGQGIDCVSLVHLNREYVRDGEIDPGELLVFADITDEVSRIQAETVDEIEDALEFLAGEIDRDGCSCLDLSRGSHCETFSLLNPAVPTPSIYNLPRLGAGKRTELVSEGIFSLANIPDEFPLTEYQRRFVDAAVSGKPQVNSRAIRSFLSELTWPLHFLDYETFASALPLMDGASPHRHFVVQYSLHVLRMDGTLTHKEYLEREASMPRRLIERMQTDIWPVGSIISWHAAFEKARNEDMAEAFPEHGRFLNDLNERMVDLEDVFKLDYVDAAFDGSTSIKKVLPVICPHLDYSVLDVHDGSSAMAEWERMIRSDPEQAEKIVRSLLSYCELDTRAMVEIHRFLCDL